MIGDLKAMREEYNYDHDSENGEDIPYRWCEKVVVGFKDSHIAPLHLTKCRAAVRYDYDNNLIEIFTPHTVRTLIMNDVLYVEQTFACDLVDSEEEVHERRSANPITIHFDTILADWAKQFSQDPRTPR